MTLSAEQLVEIMNQMTSSVPRGTTTMSEKRRSQRIERRAQVTITPYADGRIGPPSAVTLRNLSPRGICVVHARPLRAGQQFVTQLPRPTGEPAHLLCTVVHCNEVKAGQFTIGAEITCALGPGGAPAQPISDEEIERIRRSVLGEE